MSTLTAPLPRQWRRCSRRVKRQALQAYQTANALSQAATPSLPLERLRQDPARLMEVAGETPDPWQAGILRSLADHILMLCARQSGKSKTAAALALREALLRPCSLVLILAPSQRQAGELFRDKLMPLYNGLGRPVAPAYPRDNALQLVLANGSRVVALPGKEDTIVGYSGVRLLVIDEAARVSDQLYRSVRPMLAVSRGLLVALSTPFGKRGWFYEEWEKGKGWERVRITADQCPRIPAEFLEKEFDALGERWYRQEYLTSFEELVDSVFRAEDIDAACAGTMPPLFGG
jgi:hypothetical protein